MAQIGWIDFSEADRKKMKQAMSLIRPEGQLDELGIGRIRDGIANMLFPGISTIQTRAKYFFIVPYIMRDFFFLPLKEKIKKNGSRYLEDRQHEIKNILREKYYGQSNTGIIGITKSKNERISRTPAEIYWVGINTFECIDAGGLSMSSYLQNMQYIDFGPKSKSKSEEMDDDFDAGIDLNHHIWVPKAPNDWKENIDIQLTQSESDFLEDKLKDLQNPVLRNTVLQQVFHHNGLMQSLLNSNNFAQFARSAYNLPNIEQELRENLILAHDFAYVIDGAHILYNHLLQRYFFPDIYNNEFLDEWKDWYEYLSEEMIDFEGFQINSLNEWLSNKNGFENNWWNLIKEGKPFDELDIEALYRLVRNREYAAKGTKARLQNSIQMFSEMKPFKWIGLRPLEYRFSNAKRIVVDIVNAKQNA